MLNDHSSTTFPTGKYDAQLQMCVLSTPLIYKNGMNPTFLMMSSLLPYRKKSFSIWLMANLQNLNSANYHVDLLNLFVIAYMNKYQY